jgi:DNA-binding CsgD family transcriptional regulator
MGRLDGTVELLEREEPLAVLAEARAAASSGRGSVVLLTGEPGIGKTALVSRFAEEHASGARVLLGMCDDLSVPRPLGPLRNLAGPVSEALRASAASEDAADIGSRLLDELGREPRPTLLILEDVHWADEATLDAVTVVGRRVGGLPAVLLLTYRPGDLTADHPLRPVLGALPADVTRHVELHPLSAAAVATLAGEEAGRIYAATGGNPFYVTQMLATGGEELPPSVANAVIARAARLGERSRRLVELVSVVPTRADARLLDAVMPGWEDAADEPERRELLTVTSTHVRFRHELARAAIRSSIPVARRRALHGEILASLRALDGDPADLVHHAEAAGELDVVAEQAVVAARRAAAVGANREAYAHYRRAADFAERLPREERAALYEELAAAAYTANHPARGLEAVERAIELRAQLGDEIGRGRCIRLKSRIHWYAGDGAAALAAAHEAVQVLEPHGRSGALAMAYSSLSQLAMLSGRIEDTMAWGERAVELAGEVHDDRTRAHALINIGVARTILDPDDIDVLLEGHRLADALGDRHEATRALLAPGGNYLEWVRPHEAARYNAEAIAYAERYQVDTLLSYLRATEARIHLRGGDWAAAERIAWREIERDVTVAQLIAKIVLTELALRRGDADAGERLADLADQADRTGELQHIEPVLELELERALLFGEPMPVERVARAHALIGPRERTIGWEGGRLLGWSRLAGVEAAFEARMPAPHAAMAAGDWRSAADAFGAVGWTYDRALMLSLLDDDAALREALELARQLGAEPLAERITRRMRELGHRVPRGPYRASRENPLNLTDRQLEVLRLLAEGLTNAEIAERLIVSPRTAEHHVAAVLMKLEAETRRDAVRRAVSLGLVG